MFSIMQQEKLPIFFPVVMGDLLHNVNVFGVFFFHLAFNLFWKMTDASGPAYILPSRFRKDNRMLYVAVLQQT